MEHEFIGERISALLQKNNISERQLSLELGHAPGYINKITTGRTLPSIKELLYICELLKVSPAEFFIEHESYTASQFLLITEIKDLPEDDIHFLLTTIDYLKKKNCMLEKRKK